MAAEILKLKAEMTAKPDWLHVNSSITFPLSQENIGQLAEACAKISDMGTQYASVEVFFSGGRDIVLVFSA